MLLLVNIFASYRKEINGVFLNDEIFICSLKKVIITYNQEISKANIIKIEKDSSIYYLDIVNKIFNLERNYIDEITSKIKFDIYKRSSNENIFNEEISKLIGILIEKRFSFHRQPENQKGVYIIGV